MKKQALVFVLSCGRCETIFISDTLRQCPGIKTCYERNGRVLWFKLYIPFWSQKPQQFIAERKPQAQIFEITVWNWYMSNNDYSELEDSTANHFRFYFEGLKENPINLLDHLPDITGYDYELGKETLPSVIMQADKNPSQSDFPFWPS